MRYVSQTIWGEMYLLNEDGEISEDYGSSSSFDGLRSLDDTSSRVLSTLYAMDRM